MARRSSSHFVSFIKGCINPALLPKTMVGLRRIRLRTCGLEDSAKPLKARVLGNGLCGAILHRSDIAEILQHTMLDKKYGIINHEHEVFA
jgi:hypothetical protein